MFRALNVLNTHEHTPQIGKNKPPDAAQDRTPPPEAAANQAKTGVLEIKKQRLIAAMVECLASKVADHQS